MRFLLIVLFLGFTLNVSGKSPSEWRAQQEARKAAWDRIRAEIKAGRGKATLGELQQMLQCPDANNRTSAALILGDMKEDAIPAIPYLIHLLVDEEFDPRLRSAQALGDLGPLAEAAIPQLVYSLQKDPAWQVQNMAAWALGEIGPKSAKAVPALAKSLNDSEQSVQITSAWALAKIGPPALEAVPALEQQIRRAWFTKDLAAVCHVALARISGDRKTHVEAILNYMGKNGQNATEEMMRSIAYLEPQSDIAIAAIGRALINPKCKDRSEAAEILVKFKVAAVPYLEKALQDSDDSVRGEAIDSLEAILGNKIDAKKLRKESYERWWADTIKGMEPANRALDPITRNLPKVSRAEIFIFKTYLSGDIKSKPPEGAEIFPLHPDGYILEIAGKRELKGAEAEELAGYWRNLTIGYQYSALCHGPVYGIKFYQDKRMLFYSWEKLLLQTTVCWYCSNFYYLKGGFPGFAGDEKTLALKNHLENLLPLATKTKKP